MQDELERDLIAAEYDERNYEIALIWPSFFIVFFFCRNIFFFFILIGELLLSLSIEFNLIDKITDDLRRRYKKYNYEIA